MVVAKPLMTRADKGGREGERDGRVAGSVLGSRRQPAGSRRWQRWGHCDRAAVLGHESTTSPLSPHHRLNVATLMTCWCEPRGFAEMKKVRAAALGPGGGGVRERGEPRPGREPGEACALCGRLLPPAPQHHACCLLRYTSMYQSLQPPLPAAAGGLRQQAALPAQPAHTLEQAARGAAAAAGPRGAGPGGRSGEGGGKEGVRRHVGGRIKKG